MRERKGKSVIIKSILAVIAAAAVLGGAMHFIESRGHLDEQLGDSGEWGGEEGSEFYLYLNDKNYKCTDDIDAYLLIGTDAAKEGEDGFNGEMADFLMLILMDNTTKKYGMYQINRNTMTAVDILNENGESTGSETQQICISHWYGKTPEQRNGNTVTAVSNLFGELPINGYYTINMADMGKVNDAIGGVTVDIETDMTSVDPAVVEGSSVHLTGDQAEKFLRARMGVGGGTNAERMGRQRQYLQKVYNLLMSQIRENPEYVNDLYDQLHDLVLSDLHDKDLSKITNQLVVYDSQGIITLKGDTEIGLQEVSGKELEEFYPDGDALVESLQQVIQLEPADEEG